MSYKVIFAVLALAVGVGCESTAERLDKQQQSAIDTALQRARFEMNCPQATGTILSRKMIEPISVRLGIERAEYTVGIDGCGQRTTMVVVCAQDGSGCFAGGERQ